MAPAVGRMGTSCVRWATRSAQVGQAEADDLGVAVGVAAAGRHRFGLVSGLHWIMPKGTSAPGNSPTVPGLTGPVPVPASGSTRAAGSCRRSGGRLGSRSR